MYRALAFDIQRMRAPGKRSRIRVLSFPGPAWRWESGLSEAFPSVDFSFTGIEQDTGVWRQLRKCTSVMPRHYAALERPMSFLDYARARRRNSAPFGVVYLDWMGTWSRDKKKDLDQLFLGRMLSVGGVLVLTLSLRRGRPETMSELQDISHDLPLAFYDARGEGKYFSNIKVRGIPHWVVVEAEHHGIKLRPIMASVYYSETGAGNCQTQPQLQLMFLREEDEG